MRMSQPQIEALTSLHRDPAAKVARNILQALRHRGLVDDDGNMTQLGRHALSTLRHIDKAADTKRETRIHLDNEPATLAQLRLLESLWHYCPEGLSKHDASLLITFVKEQRRASTPDCDQRLRQAEALMRAGAQAPDAIAFTDTGPFRSTSGGLVSGRIIKITRSKTLLKVTIGVTDENGKTHTAKPTTLRLAGDVPVLSSNARSLFEHLAASVRTTQES